LDMLGTNNFKSITLLTLLKNTRCCFTLAQLLTRFAPMSSHLQRGVTAVPHSVIIDKSIKQHVLFQTEWRNLHLFQHNYIWNRFQSFTIKVTDRQISPISWLCFDIKRHTSHLWLNTMLRIRKHCKVTTPRFKSNTCHFLMVSWVCCV